MTIWGVMCNEHEYLHSYKSSYAGGGGEGGDYRMTAGSVYKKKKKKNEQCAWKKTAETGRRLQKRYILIFKNNHILQTP